MTLGGPRLLRRPFDAVLRPSAVVEVPSSYDASSLRERALIGGRLLALFVGNLLLYTLPLSLAGIGTVDPATTAPAWFASLAAPLGAADGLWRFSLRLLQNSVYLLTAGLVTFLAFHVGVVLTGESEGVLTSFRVVTYSTALYLATIFTLVWYASTSPNVDAAADLLLAVQAEFVYYFIDRLGADLVLPIGRPGEVSARALTPHGKAVLVGLLVAVCYYAYALYLGARTGHGTSRLTSAYVVIFVAVSPAIYVVASVLVVTLGLSVPEVLFA